MKSPDRALYSVAFASYTWRSAGLSSGESDEVTISGAVPRSRESQLTEPTNSVSVKIAAPFRAGKSPENGIIRVARRPLWR